MEVAMSLRLRPVDGGPQSSVWTGRGLRLIGVINSAGSGGRQMRRGDYNRASVTIDPYSSRSF
jgi:hypothetical protein